ncbi:DUF4913 domain-containing protein [Streptomyces sp. NBC_01410]|uniref:DUF4913 domain-containing protein n=1 Tax=Streptomyces sp. NBC_01410 TaxID=2903856 RepID=UPI0032538C03
MGVCCPLGADEEANLFPRLRQACSAEVLLRDVHGAFNLAGDPPVDTKVLGELLRPRVRSERPSTWHRDHLTHVVASLRVPSGPFAGCKAGAHRAKEAPGMDPYAG